MKRLTIILLIVVAGFGPLSAVAQNWQEVNGGLEYTADDYVLDSANNIMYMYGGARFVQDTLQINGFGRFDGTQWLEIPLVDTLCNLYCSRFAAMEYYAGDIYLSHLLDPWWEEDAKLGRFDGADFDYDFATTNGGITAMEVIDGKLWCVGGFDTLNGLPMSNIGIWDGTQWTTIDNPGFAPYASDIQEYQGNIYVCGNIHHPDMTEIMVWDGQEWSAVGGGLTNNGWANTMAVYQGELYVGGNFWKAWGAPGDNIAKWNGSEWSEVGGGTGGVGSPNGQIWQLLVHDDLLYAVGQFQFAGGQRGDFIATWDGTEWCTLTDTFDNTINEIFVFNDELYISGGFWTINGDSINRFAKWVGGDFGDSCGVVSNVPPQPQAQQLEVYPNPTSGNTNVVLPEGQRITAITVYNTLGKLVHGPTVPATGAATSATLNLSGLPAGLYVVRVQADSAVHTRKVLVSD